MENIKNNIEKEKSTKAEYWSGWNKDAANHFNVSKSAISGWHYLRDDTFDLRIKHNKLMDWIKDTMINKLGVPKDVAENKINEFRKGY